MKKQLIFVISMALSLIFVCSCGQNGRTDAESDYVEIEFYQQISTDIEANKQLFSQIISDFEAENPGIKVKQVTLPIEEVWTVLSTRIQNNDTPDIFNGWFDTEEFNLMVNGVVRDLTGSHLCDYVDPSILENHTLNGRNYILPMTLNFVGVYYNVDLFNEYNLSVPTTMDEFWSVCETLKAAGITPISAGDKDSWNLGFSSQNVMGFLMPDCVSEFPRVFDGTLKVADMSGISDFTDVIIKRSNYISSDALGADSDTMLSRFVNQEAAMMVEGANWMSALNTADLDFEYAIFPLPAKTPESTEIMVNADISLMLSATASEEKQEAADKFMEYLLTKGATYYIEQTDCPSALKDVHAPAVHYGLVASYLKEGRIFSRPIAGHWTDASFMDYCVALQNLTASGDKDAFYQEVEDALLTYGRPAIHLD